MNTILFASVLIIFCLITLYFGNVMTLLALIGAILWQQLDFDVMVKDLEEDIERLLSK